MSLLENQTFRQKINFVRNGDEENSIAFNISISTNHEIDKTIIIEIEHMIDNMLLKDYMRTEEYLKQTQEQKENEKQLKQLQMENEKLQNQIMKENEKMHKQMLKDEEKRQKQLQTTSRTNITRPVIGMKQNKAW